MVEIPNKLLMSLSPMIRVKVVVLTSFNCFFNSSSTNDEVFNKSIICNGTDDFPSTFS
jgi:hypothetical protein